MNGKIIVKNTLISLAFPVLIFVVMLAITASSEKSFINGQFIFLTADMPRQVTMNTCLTICVALAIWLQLKNGRFDFSGGASMVLTSIIAGNVAMQFGNNPWVLLVCAIVCAVILSAITAVVYIFGRLPIIICTIGMTLLYESMTYVLFSGKGANGIYSNAGASIFGRLNGIFIPTALAIFVFVIFSYYTVAGRKGKLLSNNQAASVNIGINEKTNVFISYIFTGVIIGLAAVIYVSQNNVTPRSGLATSAILFSYIVPVFMGTFIGLASCDVVGIIIAAFSMEILNYGLNCINLGGGGWQQIIMGIFMLAFYAFSSQSGNIKKLLTTIFAKFKAGKAIT